ncbi:metallophosphoesterase family protein [Pseudophaeobacter arcticus]|uniref:metallophosphoesterase family protein n=1 Tax=Pseudophaeobacter arcticus TaxID=385492 RepID=UPI0003FAA249
MLSNLLQKLRGTVGFSQPCPDRPLAIIGDVHGCADLLHRLLAKLPSDAQVILVGDYIDRGEDSAEVLRFLCEQQDLICLRGNHEDMLLRFLEDPERHGPRWLQYGGLQTLASFRIAGVHPGATPKALTECRDALLAKMGTELVEFVNRLSPSYLSGNVLVSHAGANPSVAPEYQTPNDLIWGHPDFDRVLRKDGVWVAYGHVIQDKPTVSRGRISIDTGAYATGILSAVYLTQGTEPAFISTLH